MPLQRAAGAWKPPGPRGALSPPGAGPSGGARRRRARRTALALAPALVGTGGEIALIASGAFEYLRPDAMGVSIWLPGLYPAGAPVLGQLARRVFASRDGTPG